MPRIYDLILDQESNRMVVTIPYTREPFDSHSARTLENPGITARVVLVGEKLVAYISSFPMDGEWALDRPGVSGIGDR